jgi:hypothetical protein
MFKLFKKNIIFYFKTLAIYGLLIAVLYCPTMQYEQKHDERSVDFVASVASGIQVDATNSAQKSSPPYERMLKVINLLGQCRALALEFHKRAIVFVPSEEVHVNEMRDLFDRVDKLGKQLKEEKRLLSKYRSHFRSQPCGVNKVSYVCSKGKCHYKVHDKSALYTDKAARSRSTRDKKLMRYTALTLSRNIFKIDDLVGQIKTLLDRTRLAEELAKKRSVNKAPEISSGVMR